MVVRVEEITRDVRVAMDMNRGDEPLVMEIDSDTLTLDEIVRSKIVEGVRRVVLVAPAYLLDGGLSFGDAIYWRNDGSGWILLPDDFLRLIVFKMSDWERPVYDAITDSDPRYGLQFSRFGGIRGNIQNPVVAIVRRAEGLALELFSCKNEFVTVEQGLYYPTPKMDRDGGIWIPERCYETVVYEVASLAAHTVGERELANELSELGKQVLR